MGRVLAVVVLMFAAGLADVAAQGWSWRSHDKPAWNVGIKSAMAPMKDGKLFGVGGNNKLYERVWTGSQWVWVNHGKPSSSIFNPKNFLEEPCVLRDGKLFMTTIGGELYERYWTGSQWSFGAHGNPGTKLEGCSAVYGSRAMVFTRGFDGTLRERYWTGSAWAWRNHGKPPGTDAFGTTSSYAIYGPTTRVFVPGSNGRLFRFSLDGNYNGAWQDLGAPSGKSVRKVHATEKGGIFAIMTDGEVCRWSGSWACYGKPDGNKDVWDCSDPFLIENPSLVNINTLFCVHTGSYQEVYQLSVFQGGSGWANRGKPSGTNKFVDRPTVMFTGKIPRVFVPANDGKVYELYQP
ncbi:hypothetical protein Bbelb_005110 [Branchiostoma belcheri]|nr:hypothetical protein Bbelb_005110 [Branchiostoma belcheri]